MQIHAPCSYLLVLSNQLLEIQPLFSNATLTSERRDASERAGEFLEGARHVGALGDTGPCSRGTLRIPTLRRHNRSGSSRARHLVRARGGPCQVRAGDLRDDLTRAVHCTTFSAVPTKQKQIVECRTISRHKIGEMSNESLHKIIRFCRMLSYTGIAGDAVRGCLY